MGVERSTGQGVDLVLESRAIFTQWRAPSLENDGGVDARLPSAQAAWSRAWRADAHATQLRLALGFQARF